MKQVIESKLMMGFIFMVLGLIYLNSSMVNRFENTTNEPKEELITMNVK